MTLPNGRSTIDLEKVSMSFDEHISSGSGNVIDPKEEAKLETYFLCCLSLELTCAFVYRLVRRIDMRLIPASGLFYLLSFLARANIVSHYDILFKSQREPSSLTRDFCTGKCENSQF